MIEKKNLWFLTLFSLVLVLSVYYITMPNDILVVNQNKEEKEDKVDIKETSIIETLKIENEAAMLDKINEYKETISNKDASTDDKNKAFDAIKILNQISSKEELLEEKIKLNFDLDSFIKIDEDQIRVVIESSNHSSKLANDIMNLIQDNFENKQYISVNFK